MVSSKGPSFGLPPQKHSINVNLILPPPPWVKTLLHCCDDFVYYNCFICLYCLLCHTQLNKPGRVDTSEIYTVQNVAGIMDFAFDPFNNSRLVVGERERERKLKIILKFLSFLRLSLFLFLLPPSLSLSSPTPPLPPACDDGRIRVWDIPKDGMNESLVEPTFSLTGFKPNDY